MIKEHYDVIRKNKIAFWWFLARRDLFKSILLKKCKKRFDLGADIGCGPLTNESLYEDFAEKWISIDHSRKSFEEFDKKGVYKPIIADMFSIPLKSESSELCLLLDVLEHIEDEKKALSEISRILKKEGFVLISVPAFKILWSYHDEQAGHKRRYRKENLGKLLEEAGFQTVLSTYFNGFFFLPILIIRKILRISKKGKNTIELNLSPKIFDTLFYLVLKIENFVNLNILSIPFGTSAVFLVRKK